MSIIVDTAVAWITLSLSSKSTSNELEFWVWNWVRLPEAALNDLYFFKNLFYHNNCKEAMNIGGGQIKWALFNIFVVKKYPLCIFWTLPSAPKITPVHDSWKMWKRLLQFSFLKLVIALYIIITIRLISAIRLSGILVSQKFP